MFRIKRFLLAVTLVLVGMLPGLLHPGSTGAQSDELDASQTSQNNYYYVGADMFGGMHQIGQTFTALQTGTLDRVSVYLENDPDSPLTGSLMVGIDRVTGGGLPFGTVISGGTIPLSAIPAAGSPGWVDVSISSTIVLAGTQYALILSSSGGSGHVRWYNYTGSGRSIYADGWQVGNDGSGWSAMQYVDATFKTYVVPDTVDQGQTSWNRNNLVGGGYKVAQLFTTGQYGLLDQVSVALAEYSPNPATGPVTVALYPVSGGIPAQAPISISTIPLSAIPPDGSPAWIDVALNPEIVSPGTQYALVLSVAGGGYVRWQDTNNGGSYPSGNEMTGYASGGWSDMNYSYDTAFKTWIVPDVLDQAQDRGPAYIVAAGTTEQGAQTFTAGVTGTLDRVSVMVYKQDSCPSVPLQASIQTVTTHVYAGIIPSGTQIGYGTIPWSALSTSGSWVDIPISGAVVTRGTQYALVLYSSASRCILWFANDSNWYGPGRGLLNDSGWSQPTWVGDMLFKTYVLPYVPTTMAGPPGSEIRTDTVLASSGTPSVVGQQVTFTATVHPVPDGGTVRFEDNGADMSTCTPQPVDTTSGKATCTVTYPSVGRHDIMAGYSGNSSLAGSGSLWTQDVQYGVGVRYNIRDNGKAGSTIPIKIQLTNASGQNLSASNLQVQALCVVPQGTLTCSGAPAGFDWSQSNPQSFSYQEDLGPGGGYQFNLKTTGLDVGTYQLLFRASGESDTIYHADGGVTFTLTR